MQFNSKSGTYKCKYCPKRYMIMRTYNKHLEEKHPENPEAARPSVPEQGKAQRDGLNKVLDVIAEVVQTLDDMQRVNLYANIIHDCTVGSEQATCRLENEHAN